MEDSPQLRVFDYFDYRQLLLDFIQSEKQARGKFSLSQFIQRVRGLSKGHLSLILRGKRNVAPSKIDCLGRAVGLESQGLLYFHHLVRFNQAISNAERVLFLEKMMALRPKGMEQDIPLTETSLLSDWHVLAIRELIDTPLFNPDPIALSRRFRGRITPELARDALALLLRTGMATKELDGSYRVAKGNLRTSDENCSKMIQRYHRSCLDLGKRVLDEDRVESREFSSVHLSLTKEEFHFLKTKLKRVRDETAAVEHPGDERSKVYQINIQFFPLSV